MSSNQLEIEVKSLLWSKENADQLLLKIQEHYPSYKLLHEEKQLNHYFKWGNLNTLFKNIEKNLSDEEKKKFNEIVTHGKSHSVRTRWIHNKSGVILVIKAALDEHTSHNGISRIEFEPTLDMSIEQLDSILLESGFDYLSKWSRSREEYELPEIHVSLDKNAGYGYLAEFEMVIDADGDVIQAHQTIQSIMTKLGVEELSQGRLERMFSFYNTNRPDYYGTEKVFTIE